MERSATPMAVLNFVVIETGRKVRRMDIFSSQPAITRIEIRTVKMQQTEMAREKGARERSGFIRRRVLEIIELPQLSRSVGSDNEKPRSFNAARMRASISRLFGPARQEKSLISWDSVSENAAPSGDARNLNAR